MKTPPLVRLLVIFATILVLTPPAAAVDASLKDLVSILRLRESQKHSEVVFACESFLRTHLRSAADETVRFYLAKALHDKKDYEDCIDAVSELLKAHPDTNLMEQSAMLRGECYRLLRKYDEGIPDFERARDLAHAKKGPNAAHAQYHIIQAHHSRKRNTEAQAALDWLKKEYPKASYVKSATTLLASKAKAPRPETGPKVGGKAPDIEFFTLPKGAKETLSQYSGKVVALEFWASWCGPCQAPMEKMQTYRKKNPQWGDDVKLIAVSIDNTKDKALAHLEKKGWKETHNVWAGDGGFRAKAPTAYEVRGIPSMFIIDKDGKIARKGHPGSLDTPAIINGLLKK